MSEGVYGGREGRGQGEGGGGRGELECVEGVG